MIKSAVKNDARVLAELAIQMWNDNTVFYKGGKTSYKELGKIRID